MKHEIKFFEAYDKRHPDPSQNYGISGVEIRFYVIGELGAIQFVLLTDWYLPAVVEEFTNRPPSYSRNHLKDYPLAYDLGYHCHTPMYEDQACISEDCDVIGGKCYYDGTSLGAEKPKQILVEQGSDKLWEFLDGYYVRTFGELR